LSEKIDWLVLTAANATQARGYQRQLENRSNHGCLGPIEHWEVIADPGGHRVGSGGSTLWVLHQLASLLLRESPEAKSIAELFRVRRIVVVHSGGDSRRLCAYAAQGKAFIPLPCDMPSKSEHAATLFDLIVDSLAKFPTPSCGQVMIASGDVLLTCQREEVIFQKPGVVGVAYPGSIARGSHHGVYVANDQGDVIDFLQKPDEATARSSNAVDAVGCVLIDTGVLSLDPESVQEWLTMAGSRLHNGRMELLPGLLRAVVDGDSGAIDLYEQLLMAIPPQLDLDAYVRQMNAPNGSRARTATPHQLLVQIHRSLHDKPFFVNILPFCDFFHIGTTLELFSNISGLNRTAHQFGFNNFDRSVLPPHASAEGAFVYNSMLQTDQFRAAKGVFVEACHVRDVPVELCGHNVVVGWPAEAKTPLRLPQGWGLVCLPVGEENWSAVLFGIADDFKTSWQDGGTIGNQRIDDFLVRHNLSADQLWANPDAGNTLWDARLWMEGPIDEVLEQTLWICNPNRTDRPPCWEGCKRLSMAELLERVDHDRLISHRENIQRLAQLQQLEECLTRDPNRSALHILQQIQSEEEAEIVMKQIDRLLHASDDPLFSARLYKLAQLIGERYPAAIPILTSLAGGSAEKAAFASVARAVERQIEMPRELRHAAILHDQVCWATAPGRIDLAGGWSDTPPICTELGGTVLNAAITLNGQYPIQAIAKLTDRPTIALRSIDLGENVELCDTASVLQYTDPSQWSSLAKAALVLSGLCSRDPEEKLTDRLNRLGGGIDLTLFSALPKGSGLGTSSILGAAILACLARIVGEPVDNQMLIQRTSLLEQMLTTGGGWQDQVGGITPGVKIVRTTPGPNQVPSVYWTQLDLSPRSLLQDRVLLYFTGIKRMAKNILQNVVGRYLARDPQTLRIVGALKSAAEEMKHDLDRNHINAFAGGIERYFSLKKEIDVGYTNAPIEQLIAAVDKYLVGKVLPGAGGGGFVLMIARDQEAAQEVRKILTKSPPNGQARFFDFAIDTAGLKVSVL